MEDNVSRRSNWKGTLVFLTALVGLGFGYMYVLQEEDDKLDSEFVYLQNKRISKKGLIKMIEGNLIDIQDGAEISCQDLLLQID